LVRSSASPAKAEASAAYRIAAGMTPPGRAITGTVMGLSVTGPGGGAHRAMTLSTRNTRTGAAGW
jgi:hypothetical protein